MQGEIDGKDKDAHKRVKGSVESLLEGNRVMRIRNQRLGEENRRLVSENTELRNKVNGKA